MNELMQLLNWIFQSAAHFFGTAFLLLVVGRAIGWMIHGDK